MTDPNDTRADSTRQHIMRAAAHQFALRSYSLVSLDDILVEAEVTKGAMYFHFRSKHALALAIIEDHAGIMRAAVNDLLARKLSGLETLIDISYLFAAQDVSQDAARASVNLLESIGRTDGLLTNRLQTWTASFAEVVRSAIAEGDVSEQGDPDDISRVLVSLYVGTRQVSDLDEPKQFLVNLEKAWALALPGFANPARIPFFTQFIRRRTALAMNRTSAPQDRP